MIFNVLILNSNGIIFSYKPLSEDVLGSISVAPLDKDFLMQKYYKKLVKVPLGKRVVLGLVISEATEINFSVSKLKSIIEIVHPSFRISDIQLELAKFIQSNCFCSFGEAVELFIPPKFDIRETEFVVLGERYQEAVKPEHLSAIELLNNMGFMERLEFQEETGLTKGRLDTMKKNGFIEYTLNPYDLVFKDPYENRVKLSDEQLNALNEIETHDQTMIHGVTGSGKTEIYLEAIARVLDEGRNALFLLPEISLTPHMMARVKRRFRNYVVDIIHSKISTHEKSYIYKRLIDGHTRILIGARSAIFAPLTNVGIVVVDEFHDKSYSSDKKPRYNTLELAVKYSKLHSSKLVLGSATPNIEDYYNFLNSSIVDRFYPDIESSTVTDGGKNSTETTSIYPTKSFVRLDKRYNNFETPKLTIIDLKYQSNKIISADLFVKLKQTLERKEQAILFVNRKGYSSIVLCGKCGASANCPNCDLSLTYYRSKNSLECNYCGHTERYREVCKECSEHEMMTYGVGTETVEQELAKLLPEARVFRIDRSSVSTLGKLKKALSSFENGEIDILIGTNMIAKGHDFKKVSLIGIISADIQLRLPTYLAQELAFQSFLQVAGRAGRHGLKSEVVIQTFMPTHYSITSNKYQDFYIKELEFREEMNYPPFAEILSLNFQDKNEKRVEETAIRTHQYLVRIIAKYGLEKHIRPYNAIHSSIYKINNIYRWQVLISYDRVYKEQLYEFIEKIHAHIETNKLSMIAVDVGVKNMV